ncbi:MAG TPA: hypothetical protein VF651_04025 [Gammaproteobacteria bacterium]
MDMRIFPRRAAACAVMWLCALSGCSSQPHLGSVQQRHMGKPQIVYVRAQDVIEVTDPLGTHMAHVGKFVTLNFLFGGVGAAAYFAGNQYSGGMDDDMERSAGLFSAQHWPDRVQAAMEQAVAGVSALSTASHRTLDRSPNLAEMQQLAARTDADSLVFLIPEMQMASEGDELRMTVRVVVVGNSLHHACRDCGFAPAGDQATPIIADHELEVDQSLVAVPGGATWEEQKQSGHNLHGLTDADYARFWLKGDPKPLVSFLDAAFPDLQDTITIYLGGDAPAPRPLPTLKMVVY